MRTRRIDCAMYTKAPLLFSASLYLYTCVCICKEREKERREERERERKKERKKERGGKEETEPKGVRRGRAREGLSLLVCEVLPFRKNLVFFLSLIVCFFLIASFNSF